MLHKQNSTALGPWTRASSSRRRRSGQRERARDRCARGGSGPLRDGLLTLDWKKTDADANFPARNRGTGPPEGGKSDTLARDADTICRRRGPAVGRSQGDTNTVRTSETPTCRCLTPRTYNIPFGCYKRRSCLSRGIDNGTWLSRNRTDSTWAVFRALDTEGHGSPTTCTGEGSDGRIPSGDVDTAASGAYSDFFGPPFWAAFLVSARDRWR